MVHSYMAFYISEYKASVTCGIFTSQEPGWVILMYSSLKINENLGNFKHYVENSTAC
jgi:hypothetical protein